MARAHGRALGGHLGQRPLLDMLSSVPASLVATCGPVRITLGVYAASHPRTGRAGRDASLTVVAGLRMG